MKKEMDDSSIKVIVENPLTKDQIENRIKKLSEFLSKNWHLKVNRE